MPVFSGKPPPASVSTSVASYGSSIVLRLHRDETQRSGANRELELSMAMVQNRAHALAGSSTSRVCLRKPGRGCHYFSNAFCADAAIHADQFGSRCVCEARYVDP